MPKQLCAVSCLFLRWQGFLSRRKQRARLCKPVNGQVGVKLRLSQSICCLRSSVFKSQRIRKNKVLVRKHELRRCPFQKEPRHRLWVGSRRILRNLGNGGDRFRLYFGGANAATGTAVVTVGVS